MNIAKCLGLFLAYSACKKNEKGKGKKEKEHEGEEEEEHY